MRVENVQEKDELREEYPLNKFVYVDWSHHGLSIQEFWRDFILIANCKLYGSF